MAKLLGVKIVEIDERFIKDAVAESPLTEDAAADAVKSYFSTTDEGPQTFIVSPAAGASSEVDDRELVAS